MMVINKHDGNDNEGSNDEVNIYKLIFFVLRWLIFWFIILEEI